MPFNNEQMERLNEARVLVPAGLYLHPKTKGLYLTRGPALDQSDPDGPIRVPYWSVIRPADGVTEHQRTVEDFIGVVELPDQRRMERFIFVAPMGLLGALDQARSGPLDPLGRNR